MWLNKVFEIKDWDNINTILKNKIVDQLSEIELIPIYDSYYGIMEFCIKSVLKQEEVNKDE